MLHLRKHLPEVIKQLAGKFIFLFLDYDGTLAPIAQTPGQARILPELKKILSRLALRKGFKLAVVSGRALEDIKKRINLKHIVYAGNHGLQIEGPEIKHQIPVPVGYKRILRRIRAGLKQRLGGVKGILLEDKGLSLALHFRLVDRKQVNLVKNIFRQITNQYLKRKMIRIRPGKEVLEVMPAIEWNKGKIVKWLLAGHAAKISSKETAPIYIGDDATDEDAFAALKGKGVTVVVGRRKHSRAAYYLMDTGEVRDFLKRILTIK